MRPWPPARDAARAGSRRPPTGRAAVRAAVLGLGVLGHCRSSLRSVPGRRRRVGPVHPAGGGESRSAAVGPASRGRPRGGGAADGRETRRRSVRSCGDTRAARRRRPGRRRGGRRSAARWPSPSRTRSSSSAPRTASTATTPPTSRCSWPSRRPAAARGRRAARRASCASADGHRRRRRRRPGLPQHHPGPGRAGRGWPRDVVDGRRRRTGSTEPLAGAAAQPRVRLGQPDRPAAHRRHPLGRGRRRAGPAAAAPAAPRSPASTTSTTPARRSTGSPRRCWPRAQRPADARGRLRRRLHRRHRRPRSSPSEPGRAGPARRRGSRRCSGARGVELMFAEIKRSRWPTSASTSTSTSPRTTLHERGARRRGGRPAARAGPRLRGRRRGLAADDRLRRRQGPGAGQARRRADLLRRRLRLLPGQARARLRPVRHHARRRPPRLRRPAARRSSRRFGDDPDDEPRDPHRPAGEARAATASRCG